MRRLPNPGVGRPRGLSVRAQLTLSYAALLVLVGLVLFAIGLLILRFIPEGNLIVVGGAFAPGRDDLIEVYVRYCLGGILALAAIGLGGGWLLAGRMLRPLRRITEAALRARDGDWQYRIRMPGRQNELAALADAFDDMLGRVQRSVDEQRRFAANASHELRTPHAIMRTMLEVARADPEGRNTDELLARLDETNDRSIELIEALLALAATEHYDPPSTTVDLDELVAGVVADARVRAARPVSIETTLDGGEVVGDATLVRQLVANLVQNAVIHNHAAGTVWISTTRTAHETVLTVVNTGEELDRALVDTLTAPFVRGRGRARRPGDGGGSGLGLAIVSSIVRAHRGSLTLESRVGGGLTVRVALPTAVSPTYRNPPTAP